MNWPDLDYKTPDVQMSMIKQFEDVASTPYIVEIDTRYVLFTNACELSFVPSFHSTVRLSPHHFQEAMDC